MYEEENMCRSYALRGWNHFVQLVTRDGETLGSADVGDGWICLFDPFCRFPASDQAQMMNPLRYGHKKGLTDW